MIAVDLDDFHRGGSGLGRQGLERTHYRLGQVVFLGSCPSWHDPQLGMNEAVIIRAAPAHGGRVGAGLDGFDVEQTAIAHHIEDGVENILLAYADCRGIGKLYQGVWHLIPKNFQLA